MWRSASVRLRLCVPAVVRFDADVAKRKYASAAVRVCGGAAFRRETRPQQC